MASLPELARSIFARSIDDCSIDRSVERIFNDDSFIDGTERIHLDNVRHLRIVAAGKAASAMTSALLSRLPVPSTCDLQGVLIGIARPENLHPAIRFYAGGHPVPNAASFAGASAALTMMRSARALPPEHTLCIFLISGGASSMMELPLDSSISLDDTVAFHQALVHSGASIVEMNCLRKHFSAVKGGRLALAAGLAKKISLLVSDVPPGNLDALGSGPTVPDSTTVAQCREILLAHGLLERFPASVQALFESGHLAETPKPDQIASPVLKLLDSDNLAEAARSLVARLGFHVVIDNTCDDWNYAAAADYLLDRVRRLRIEHPRVCLVSTGEISVKLPTSSTRMATSTGGRNQHFALYAATKLEASDARIAILSAGSDGIDGNSLAAGAVVDEMTLQGNLPFSRKESAFRALADFNSSALLSEAGATVVTGPTGNNLRDLRLLLAEPRE